MKNGSAGCFFTINERSRSRRVCQLGVVPMKCAINQLEYFGESAFEWLGIDACFSAFLF